MYGSASKPLARRWSLAGRLLLPALLLALAAPGPCPAAGDEALRRSLGDTDVAEEWVYDDWEGARERARGAGKPLFAVFRCVP